MTSHQPCEHDDFDLVSRVKTGNRIVMLYRCRVCLHSWTEIEYV